jgi:hypothetical protein
MQRSKVKFKKSIVMLMPCKGFAALTDVQCSFALSHPGTNALFVLFFMAPGTAYINEHLQNMSGFARRQLLAPHFERRGRLDVLHFYLMKMMSKSKITAVNII